MTLVAKVLPVRVNKDMLMSHLSLLDLSSFSNSAYRIHCPSFLLAILKERQNESHSSLCYPPADEMHGGRAAKAFVLCSHKIMTQVGRAEIAKIYVCPH